MRCEILHTSTVPVIFQFCWYSRQHRIGEARVVEGGRQAGRQVGLNEGLLGHRPIIMIIIFTIIIHSQAKSSYAQKELTPYILISNFATDITKQEDAP